MSDVRMPKDVFIHPQALVESSDVGPGTRVWAFAHILKGATIGDECNICDHTFIESDVILGNRVTVKCGCYLWDGLRIADDVFVGPNATFTNDMRPRSKAYPEKFPHTYLEQGASIGANATILCEIKIGKWAIVGAGSVVTKSVPDFALVYGNPAKIHGYVCQCTQNLVFNDTIAHCSCGQKYTMENEVVTSI